MGRSTFEGPILAGDNRFGQQRDVGLAKLAQYANLVLTNTTAGTAGFGGSSGTFVSSNNIPNNIGTIWTPQSGVYSNTGPTVATAPTATDACAGTITGTTSDPLTYSTQGTFTITWVFNDGNGNNTNKLILPIREKLYINIF